jgi:hypothetical protein
MSTNIIGYLPAVGFFGRTTVLDLESRISSKEKLGSQKETPAGEVERLNAYKVAVLLAVGATILSVL